MNGNFTREMFANIKSVWALFIERSYLAILSNILRVQYAKTFYIWNQHPRNCQKWFFSKGLIFWRFTFCEGPGVCVRIHYIKHTILTFAQEELKYNTKFAVQHRENQQAGYHFYSCMKEFENISHTKKDYLFSPTLN